MTENLNVHFCQFSSRLYFKHSCSNHQSKKVLNEERLCNIITRVVQVLITFDIKFKCVSLSASACHSGTWRRLDFYSRRYINISAPIRTDYTHAPNRCLFGSRVELKVPYKIWLRTVKKKRPYYMDFEIGYQGLTVTMQGLHIKTQYVKSLRLQIGGDNDEWNLIEETVCVLSRHQINKMEDLCGINLASRHLLVEYVSCVLWEHPGFILVSQFVSSWSTHRTSR
jgi:hypothetical protein